MDSKAGLKLRKAFLVGLEDNAVKDGIMCSALSLTEESGQERKMNLLFKCINKLDPNGLLFQKMDLYREELFLR